MPHRRLIIGYGNTLRGDDGAGFRAAERLTDARVGADTRVLACAQLTPDLADDLRRVDQVVFIDASLAVPPGAVEIRTIEPDDAGAVDLHACDAEQLVAITQAMFGRAPVATLVHIGAADLSLTDRLSPAVEAAVDHVLDLLAEMAHA